jgi:hypothetical protein
MSVLGFMAAALVMGSLALIVGFGLVLAGFAVRTLITASRPNELWADLDEVLAEILQGTDSALPAE